MDFNPSKLCSVDGGDLTFMAAAGQGELSLLKPHVVAHHTHELSPSFSRISGSPVNDL